MSNTLEKKSPSPKAKREPSASDCASEDVKPPTKRAKGGGGGSRAWSSDDYIALLDHVLEHGTGKATFTDAVEGLTKSQAYDTWRRRALPCIREALIAKGKGDKGDKGDKRNKGK